MRLIKGINKDISDSVKPEGLTTFTLNGNLDDFTGNLGTLSTEGGNTECWNLPEGYIPIGSINLDRNEVVIFSTNGSNSEIGIVGKNCDYETIINSSGLGFNSKYSIKGFYRILGGCERVVYFIDGFNPDRVVNLDDLLEYTDEATAADANTFDNWNVDAFKLQRKFTPPYIQDVEVLDTGGSLKLGTYQFAIEVLDGGLNRVGINYNVEKVNIVDDNLSGDYYSIDGGLNIETATEASGGVPLTSKSIKFDITNLDDTYEYVRVYVIRKSTHNGITEEVFVKADLIEITNSTLTYILSNVGTGADGDTSSTLEEVVVGNEFYETSQEILQVDKRCVRANLKSPRRDISAYQRYVNEYVITPVIREVPVRDITQSGTAKNPITPIDGMSYMGNEVYGVGVVFQHDTGEESSAYHIPGRVATSFDTQLLTVGTDVSESDVAHLGLVAGDTVARWKVFNTSSGGNMAYYESESGVYPSTVDGNGDFIYGDLAGQPIRHHRFPDRGKEPILSDDGENIRLLGIELSNVTYPDNSIVGHYLVVAPRDSFNRTIIDKGYVARQSGTTNIFSQTSTDYESGIFRGTFNHSGYTEETPYAAALFPKTFLTDSYVNAEFLKFESQIKYAGEFSRLAETRSYDSDDDTYDISYLIPDATLGRHEVPIGGEANRQLLGNIIVNRCEQAAYYFLGYNGEYGPSYKAADNTFDVPVANYSYLNKTNVLKLNDKTPDVPFTGTSSAYEFFYVSAAVSRDIHRNIANIKYYKTHSNPVTGTNTFFNGDVYIAEYIHNDLYQNDAGSVQSYIGVAHNGLFIESEINSELRHTGTDSSISGTRVGGDNEEIDSNCASVDYYQGYPDDPFEVWRKVFLRDTSGIYSRRDNPCPEFVGYNEDYTFVRSGKVYLAVPTNFNYSALCTNEYPNRIVWSGRSFSDERLDNFRIFRANDYTTVGVSGITNIHYDRNRMLVLTKDSAFLMSPNPRAINTDLDTAYLSTGDFLGIPAKEFVTKNIGFAGNQGRFNDVSSEYGYTFVDQEDGVVYNFGDKLNVISDKGLYAWFKENLEFKLVSELARFGIDYPFTDSGNDGIGLTAVLDPRYDRYILHKTDYKPLNFKGKYRDRMISGYMYYNSDTDEFTVDGKVIELGDPNWFEISSWTLSYSYRAQVWESFHSYQPSFMYVDVNHFYSFNYNNVAWRHEDRNFLSYYGTKYPFIVEHVKPLPVSYDLDVLEWYTRARTFNESTGTWVSKPLITFNEGLVYNDVQSTGLFTIDMINKDEYPYGKLVGWSNVVKEGVRSQNIFRVNDIRNIQVSEVITDESYNSAFYNGQQGYIDITPVGFDVNLNEHNLSMITGEYNFIRLIYNPNEDDNQLILDVIDVKKKTNE